MTKQHRYSIIVSFLVQSTNTSTSS